MTRGKASQFYLHNSFHIVINNLSFLSMLSLIILNDNNNKSYVSPRPYLMINIQEALCSSDISVWARLSDVTNGRV